MKKSLPVVFKLIQICAAFKYVQLITVPSKETQYKNDVDAIEEMHWDFVPSESCFLPQSFI